MTPTVSRSLMALPDCVVKWRTRNNNTDSKPAMICVQHKVSSLNRAGERQSLLTNDQEEIFEVPGNVFSLKIKNRCSLDSAVSGILVTFIVGWDR